MRNFVTFLILSLSIIGCSRAKDKTKEVINSGGEVLGESIGEFGKGVASGVKEAFEINIHKSEDLMNLGLDIGKIYMENDQNGGTDNVLVVYLIFKEDFDQTITLKVFDNKDLEMGRSQLHVEQSKGKAGYYEFRFDNRTDIDSDSKLVMF